MILPKMVKMLQFSHVHLISYENGMFLVTNPAPIDKTLVKKIKFGDNLSTEIEPKSNCYYPRAPNGKYIDNHSLNTLKRDLQICLPSNGCFLFDDIQSKCPKSSEK